MEQGREEGRGEGRGEEEGRGAGGNMGGEMREGNGGMTSDEKMKVERSRGRGEERRGAGGGYHANQCLAVPQANDPEAVCGGDRFEALEAQMARMVDQCAAVQGGRCHSLPRRAASFH